MYKSNNFTEKQNVMKWCSYKRNWTMLLIILNILLLYCEINDAIVLQFRLPGTGDSSKLNFQCKPRQNQNPGKNDESELCKNSTIDAIIIYRDETYVFKGAKYWRQVDNGLAPGYPKLISQRWPGLPNNISAAFTDLDDKYVYFFKGAKFWKYDGEVLEDNYPRLIEDYFPGVPNDIQATAMWKRGGKLYVFKEKSYWKVDISKRPFNVSKPFHLGNSWKGIPINVDAALRAPGYFTYFFKNGRYYKYSERNDTLVKANPPYPRRVATDWFGCSKSVRVIED